MSYTTSSYPNYGASGYPTPKVPSGYQHAQLPNFTPQLMDLYNQQIQSLLGSGGGGLDFLSKLAMGSPEAFESMEAPAYTAFNKTLGQIGTRFSGLGARDSSAFENAVAGAGAELSENLAAKRNALRMQAIQSLLGQSQALYGAKPYENVLSPNQQSSNPFNTLLSGIGASLPFLFL